MTGDQWRHSLIDDAFARAHPHDWATGERLAREFTAGTVALIEYYVEQHGAITSAQARLHALQVARLWRRRRRRR